MSIGHVAKITEVKSSARGGRIGNRLRTKRPREGVEPSVVSILCALVGAILIVVSSQHYHRAQLAPSDHPLGMLLI